MRRPDQNKFDLFVKHFEKIDPLLQNFADKHGLSLDINTNRYPCRILRKPPGNPSLLIEISMDDHWLDVEYDENLPHSLGIAAYYVPPTDELSRWGLSVNLVKHQTFSTICQTLEERLETALKQLESWTPDIIMERGKCFRNIQKERELGLSP